MFRGDMSFRELWVLLKHLPPESWTQTELRDTPREDLEEMQAPAPKFGPWSLLNYQMAQLMNLLEKNTSVTAWSAGSKDYPKPKPVPQPGQQKSEPKELPPAAQAYLQNLRATG